MSTPRVADLVVVGGALVLGASLALTGLASAFLVAPSLLSVAIDEQPRVPARVAAVAGGE